MEPIRINKSTVRIPILVDENTIKSVNRHQPWSDFEFDCPLCGGRLIISSMKLELQDDNDAQWVGNCPSCKGLINIFQPD